MVKAHVNKPTSAQPTWLAYTEEDFYREFIEPMLEEGRHYGVGRAIRHYRTGVMRCTLMTFVDMVREETGFSLSISSLCQLERGDYYSKFETIASILSAIYRYIEKKREIPYVGERLYTKADVARDTNRSRGSVWNAVDSGMLPAIKIAGRHWITEDALRAYKEYLKRPGKPGRKARTV